MIHYSDSFPPDAKLVFELLLYHGCYICLISGSSTVLIKQPQVADAMHRTFVARIKISSVKPKK